MAKPKTVAEYIKDHPPKVRLKLQQIRKCVKAAAPGAKEDLKWNLPSISYKRILVIYGAFKNHIGFYPTPGPLKAFAKELSKYKTAKGSVQFPMDKPLPLALIRKITKFRVKESLSEDKKWKE